MCGVSVALAQLCFVGRLFRGQALHWPAFVSVVEKKIKKGAYLYVNMYIHVSALKTRAHCSSWQPCFGVKSAWKATPRKITA